MESSSSSSAVAPAPVDVNMGGETPMGEQELRPFFELKKWCAVALWSWNVEVDNCAICRNHIMDPCINCQSTLNATNRESQEVNCTLAWGVCNHAFHAHCIQRWIQTRNVCPLDNQTWELDPQRTNAAGSGNAVTR
eukprot:GHVU01008037.1.p1 GENE.GHVU01008037.1~~GHVU01008037.1.p1  ORF type:complete len:136 (+),score=15.02 GHVU01008037.1:596-1003(+)